MRINNGHLPFASKKYLHTKYTRTVDDNAILFQLFFFYMK